MFLINRDNLINYSRKNQITIGNVDSKFMDATCYRFRLGNLVKQRVSFDPDLPREKRSNTIDIENGFLKVEPGCFYEIQSHESFTLGDCVQAFISQTTNLALKGFQLISGLGVDPSWVNPGNSDHKLKFVLKSLINEAIPISHLQVIGKIYFYDITDTFKHDSEDAGHLYVPERERLLKS